MKNNIISKPAVIALSLGALCILAIIGAAVFFGIPYNAFYLLHNLENIAEAVLLLSIIIAAFAFSIYFIKNIYDKNADNICKNKENNDENIKTLNKNYEKNKKAVIIALSAFALLLAAALFIFSGRFFAVYYILDNLEDIFEGVFKLVLTASLLVFLAVFFKKVWNKI